MKLDLLFIREYSNDPLLVKELWNSTYRVMSSTSVQERVTVMDHPHNKMKKSTLQSRRNKISRIPVLKANKRPRPFCTSPLKSRVTMETKRQLERSKTSTASTSVSTTSSNQPSKNSRVKRVPNFNKLHKQWANKLEKNKQASRTHSQYTKSDKSKDPVITTANEKENSVPSTHNSTERHSDKVETRDAQLEENFEIVPQSLDDILSNQPLKGGVSERLTLAVSNISRPRQIPGEFIIPHGMNRMSFYSRKPRHCQQSLKSTEYVDDSAANLFNRLVQSTVKSVKTKAKVKKDSVSFSQVKLNLEDQLSQVDENMSSSNDTGDLFDRLVKSTIKSTRTISKLKNNTEEFRHVRFNLEDELTRVESVDNSSLLNNDPGLYRGVSSDVLSSTFTVDGDLIDSLGTNYSDVIPPKCLFYEVEQELCAIFDQPTTRPYIEGRKGCNNPLASVLDKHYMVPAELSNDDHRMNFTTCSYHTGPMYHN